MLKMNSKNGKVVKRPDKDILNARLKKIYDMYYERCMKSIC